MNCILRSIQILVLSDGFFNSFNKLDSSHRSNRYPRKNVTMSNKFSRCDSKG